MAEPLRIDPGGTPVANQRPIRIEFNADGSVVIFVDPRLFQATTSAGRSNGSTVELMTKILITPRLDEPPAPSNARPTEMQQRISAAVAESRGEPG